MPLLPRHWLLLCLPLFLLSSTAPVTRSGDARGAVPAGGAAPDVARAGPEAGFARLVATACASGPLLRIAEAHGVRPCDGADASRARPAVASVRPFAAVPAAEGDGTLLARQRLATFDQVAIDLVAYTSSNLAVTGLLCFVDDGVPRSTVIHLHGGLGGIFVNPDGGDIVGTCFSWARDHGRTAFVPSFRGQDGGQGEPELCLGEADDVAAGAVLLRSLDVVDPDRIGLVGGSMGGCVALRAGTKIPNLRAVVAIAPPTDWQAFIAHHRDGGFVPEVETRCDGSTVDWDLGGPEYADTIDEIICGQPGCSEADYAARSPIPDVVNATNPTLVIAAGADNLVPVQQQVLWSALRNVVGGSVAVEVRDRCSEPAPPPLADDALLFVPGAYHLMEDGPVVSGLLYLVQQLDAAGEPPAQGL